MITGRHRTTCEPHERLGGIALSAAIALLGCLLVSGCSTSQLNKHAVAVSTSLAPVVDQAAAAYRDAEALHNQREGYEAVVAYQAKDAKYDPSNAPLLLSEKDIQARLAVLAALQVYSKSLIELTGNPDSAQLDAAAKSVGGNLTSLGNDLAPSFENVRGIAAASGTTTTVTTVSGSTSTTTTSTAAAPLLSPEVRNGISTAVDALGQFFVTRLVEKELPAKIEAMEPHVQVFCKTLDDDIHALDGIEQRDYNRILDLEKQFILQDEQSAGVNPQTHRAEIMQLPAIARQQKEAHERLSALHDAINNFALTHHALAAAAQNNNPESLKQKLGELADAGSSLGKFYSSLPAN